MKVETEFNIGDTVYIIYGGTIHKHFIGKIKIFIEQSDIDSTNTEIYYRMGEDNGLYRKASGVYKSEIDAANGLLKKAGISAKIQS